MLLGEVCHMRSGDKGDIANISLVPWEPADYDWIGQVMTAERVAEIFGPLVRGTVTRYELPGIHAYNFVMTDALDGGVSRSLNLDVHGKAYGVLMAEAEIGDRPHETKET
jgi:hypothetical protein